MVKYDDLAPFVTAVLIDCYGHHRAEASISVSCGSPSTSGREDCSAQERITLDKNDNVSDHENEVRESLEGTLARHGVKVTRDGSAIRLDTQSLHRAKYATGEVADMLGVPVAQVVNAYRAGHNGREPSGGFIFPMYSVVDLGREMSMPSDQIVRHIETYNALRAVSRKD